MATTVNKTCKKTSPPHNSELENQIYGINRGVPNESIRVYKTDRQTDINVFSLLN